MENEHISDMQLALYASGNPYIPPQTRSRIQRHLPTCQVCSQRLEIEIEKVIAAHGQPSGEALSGEMSRQLHWWARRRTPAIAALIFLAVGVGSLYFWPRGAKPIGIELVGRFAAETPARNGEQPSREYVVEVRLDRDAYLTFLYLDPSRRLQLPENTGTSVTERRVNRREIPIDLAGDPPGPQWIVAAASNEPFSPLRLRNDLQRVLDSLPRETPFDRVVARLEQALCKHSQLSFMGHRFEAPRQ